MISRRGAPHSGADAPLGVETLALHLGHELADRQLKRVHRLNLLLLLVAAAGPLGSSEEGRILDLEIFEVIEVRLRERRVSAPRLGCMLRPRAPWSSRIERVIGCFAPGPASEGSGAFST